MNFTNEQVSQFVYKFIKEYEMWTRDIVRPNMLEAVGNDENNQMTEIGKQREKLVNDEFNKRIGVMFIGPIQPRSYGGIYTEKGFASNRHGVDGEKVCLITNNKKDEWAVETKYEYKVSDVKFSHYYRYYIVNVDGFLRMAKIMIIDKGEIGGNTIYQEL